MQNERGKIDRSLDWLFGNAWAVREGSWKLIGRGEAVLSLVNLEQDLAESSDQRAAQPARVERLRELHRRWIGVVGDR